MSKAYPTVAHEWFEEVWNQRNDTTIDRLLHPDAVIHGITSEDGQELRGPAAFRKFHSGFIRAFPNLRVEVVDTVVEGDKIAARCVVRGRHTGEGIGPKATHCDCTFTGICIAVVKDGKMVEAWNNFDFLKMHADLGTLGTLAQ